MPDPSIHEPRPPFSRKQTLIMGAITFAIGVIALIIAQPLIEYGNILPLPVYISAATALLTGFAYLLLYYLRYGGFSEIESRLSRDEISMQRHVLHDVKSAIAELHSQTKLLEKTSSILSESDRNEIVAKTKDKIAALMGDELLVQIEQKYGDAVAEQALRSRVTTLCDETKRRLEREAEALTRRSNVNLVIGVITTLLAVGLLAYIVLTSDITKTDGEITITTMLLHFLPRLSLVIFIEIFSFFFLRLYKNGLEDIKYYQNELTTIETSFVALECALQTDKSEAATAILTQLSNEDRNRASVVGGKQKESVGVGPEDLKGVLGKITEMVNAFNS